VRDDCKFQPGTDSRGCPVALCPVGLSVLLGVGPTVSLASLRGLGAAVTGPSSSLGREDVRVSGTARALDKTPRAGCAVIGSASILGGRAVRRSVLTATASGTPAAAATATIVESSTARAREVGCTGGGGCDTIDVDGFTGTDGVTQSYL
jgi:hypothetical protein